VCQDLATPRTRCQPCFDQERYRERNKVETAFSVLKRRFGEELKARKYWYQIKEIKSKVILHNLTKAGRAVVIVVVWEEFNRAVISIINSVFPPIMTSGIVSTGVTSTRAPQATASSMTFGSPSVEEGRTRLPPNLIIQQPPEQSLPFLPPNQIESNSYVCYTDSLPSDMQQDSGTSRQLLRRSPPHLQH
jgi:hypothetical protein